MSDLLRPTTIIRDEILGTKFPQQLGTPQLLWPSIRYGQQVENHDVSCFPSIEDVRGRYDARQNVRIVLKLAAFETALITASVRILVLDPHFDEIGVNVLAPTLPSSQAADIRLLTGRGVANENEKDRLRKMLTQYRNSGRVDAHPVEVRWSATLDRRLFPFLHDRFAIVDEGLWHFGSTVGGGHPGLTAVSGPWPAAGTRATEFFDECWRLCNA